MAASPAAAGRLESVILQLCWQPQFQFAGYYAARELGYYREAGFDVAILPGVPEMRVVDEVLAGRAHYGVGGAELAVRRLAGAPVVSLAAIFQHSPLVLIVRRDAGICCPNALGGKYVMLRPGIESLALVAMLVGEGVDLDSIRRLPPSYDIDDLIAGRTDAYNGYVTNEPFLLECRGVSFLVISPRQYGIDFYGDCLFTTEAEVAGRSVRVAAFREASLRGWRYALDHPEETITLLIESCGVERSHEHLRYEAEKMRELIRPDLVDLGHQNPGRWEFIAETIVDLDLAPAGGSIAGLVYDPLADEYRRHERLRNVALAVGMGLAISVFGILILALFARQLKRQVAAKTRELENQRDRLEELVAERSGEVRDANLQLQEQLQALTAAERQSKENEDRYRGLFNAMGEGVAVYEVRNNGADFYFTEFNRAAEKMDGRTRDQVLGRSLRALYPAVDEMGVTAAMRRVWETGETAYLPLRRYRDDRIEVMRENWIYRLPTGEVMAVYEDSTEKYRVLADLQISEARYRRLFEEVPIALWEIDLGAARKHMKALKECRIDDIFGYMAANPENVQDCLRQLRVLAVNRAARELFGLEQDNHDAVLREIFGGACSADFCRVMGRLYGGQKQTLSYECTCRRLDGGPLTVLMHLQLPPGAGAEDWSRVLMATLDVSELKAREAEQQRLAAVVDQSMVDVLITDVKGNIVYVNQTFSRYTGYTAAEAVGNNPRILKSGHHGEAFYRDLWGTVSRGDTWTGLLVNRRKDGSIFYEDAVIFPVKDASGGIVNYASVKLDVTKERELEDQLRQSQKLEAIGQLAGGVAHDFNNIMTAIIGYSELMLEHLPEGDRLWKDVNHIKAAGNRAAALTRQLLAFSRKQIIQLRKLAINRLIRDLEQMLSRLIGEDITLELRLADGLPMIDADPGQLDQLLVNLVVNAVDAIRCVAQPAVRRIVIGTEMAVLDDEFVSRHPDSRPGEFVHLQLADSGCGIDPEVIGRIFDPFFTTKEVGQGSGLGLSMVYGVMKQNRGMIYVNSTPGQGTSFDLYWPIPQAAGSGKTAVGEAGEPGGEGVVRGGSILVVEDDEEVRKVATRGLHEAGYPVASVETAEQALELLDAGRLFDLVITDVVMPGMDGYALAAEISRRLPRARLFFISGYPDYHKMIDRHRLGGRKLLQKPFTVSELLVVVREILTESGAKGD
ncbi:MAG: ABC transporter substrate-binding protein [Deltaproteobacteria bacterium]|nr:ABC transporter substrate-binding protein [Candidatus Anaeroferrophillacea bacterium]